MGGFNSKKNKEPEVNFLNIDFNLEWMFVRIVCCITAKSINFWREIAFIPNNIYNAFRDIKI